MNYQVMKKVSQSDDDTFLILTYLPRIVSQILVNIFCIYRVSFCSFGSCHLYYSVKCNRTRALVDDDLFQDSGSVLMILFILYTSI